MEFYNFDSFCFDFEVDNRSTLFDVDNLLEGSDVNLASYSLGTETDTSLPGFTRSASISSGNLQCDQKNNTSLLAKSPWHESDSSDSGVSETFSSLDSPQPKTPLTGILEDFKCDESFTSFLVDKNNTVYSALKNEVCSNGVNNENHTDGKGRTSTNGFFMKARVPQLSKINTVCSKTLYNAAESESDDLNSEDMNFDEDDSNHDVAQQKNHAALKLSKEIKIVHVKPSNGITSDEIMKALDERSKKNAQQAKINREKKKAYIKSLEMNIDVLKFHNEELKSENSKVKTENASLVDEIKYLKSVLVNSSALSSILANISSVTEVQLSTSMRKRKTETDHNYVHEEPTSKQSRTSSNLHERAGICLHVSGTRASLEFCAHCSSMAQTTLSATSK